MSLSIMKNISYYCYRSRQIKYHKIIKAVPPNLHKMRLKHIWGTEIILSKLMS